MSLDMSSRLQKGINKRVKEGRLTPEQGKAVLHKLKLTDRLMELYKEVSKTTESRFTEETLPKTGDISIEPIRWDIESAEGEDEGRPIFFEQIPHEEFQKYRVKEFNVGELMDPREYCNAAELQLLGCLGAVNTQAKKTLLWETGWDAEKYNYTLFHERGRDEDNLYHRYDWGMARLMQHKDDRVNHSIALSTNQCDEPDRILRSELMILILLMWAKGRLFRSLYLEITPVLLVSIRRNHFRVIEAYYDGSKLVVRDSSPLPLEPEDPPEKQRRISHLILRWFASKPVRVEETSSFDSLKKAFAAKS